MRQGPSYHTTSSSDGVVYLEDGENCTFQPPDSTVMSNFPGMPHRQYSNEAWNHLWPTVHPNEPSYAAFGPVSPSASLVNGFSHEEHKPTKSQKKSRATVVQKASPGERPTSLAWAHTVVREGELETHIEPAPEQSLQKTPSRRRSKLLPATRAKAKKVRDVHACWKCVISKVSVSVSYLLTLHVYQI